LAKVSFFVSQRANAVANCRLAATGVLVDNDQAQLSP